MAAKKKPAAKTTAKKVTKNPPVQTDRCPTCGMAPCNVPADMRKTGKPKAKPVAKPRAKRYSVPVPVPEPVTELTPSAAVLDVSETDEPIDDEGLTFDVCPLCDEPEDECTCGDSVDDEVLE